MRFGARRVVVALVAVLACLLLSASALPGGRAQGAGPSVVIVFKGSGKGSVSNTQLQAGNADASITLFWTLTWDFPSELARTPMDVSGNASQTLLPAAGPPCSGPVTTFNGVPERLQNPPGKEALPVPLIIGFAAKTCYDPDGGGTSWYAYYSGGNYTAAQAQDVAYAHVPEIDASNPKPACYAVRSIYWHDVIPASGGNTITQDIQWEGVVYVEVNGHKDTSCKAPPPATGPSQGTPQRPTLPEAPWRSYLRRVAMGFRDGIRDVRANARKFRSRATPWVKLGPGPLEPLARVVARDLRILFGRPGFGPVRAPPPPPPPPPDPPTDAPELENVSLDLSAQPNIAAGSLGSVTKLNGVITLNRAATALLLSRRPFTLRVKISTRGARNRVAVATRYRIGP